MSQPMIHRLNFTQIDVWWWGIITIIISITFITLVVVGDGFLTLSLILSSVTIWSSAGRSAVIKARHCSVYIKDNRKHRRVAKLASRHNMSARRRLKIGIVGWYCRCRADVGSISAVIGNFAVFGRILADIDPTAIKSPGKIERYDRSHTLHF